MGIPLEKAIETEEKYFKAFPGLKKYFDKTKKETLERGYILVDNITGRRSYFSNWHIFTDLKDKLENYVDEEERNGKFFQGLSKEFWSFYTFHKKSTSPLFLQSLKADVGKYFRIKGKLERDALNYPVQGVAASMTKLAMIYMFEYICDNDLWDTVKLVNAVHDEICVECPKEIAEQIRKELLTCMERAGRVFCKTIPVTADAEISFKWEH